MLRKLEKVLGLGYLSKTLWTCGLARLIFQKLYSRRTSLKFFSDVIVVSGMAQPGCNFATEVNCGQTEIPHGRHLSSWIRHIHCPYIVHIHKQFNYEICTVMEIPTGNEEQWNESQTKGDFMDQTFEKEMRSWHFDRSEWKRSNKGNKLSPGITVPGQGATIASQSEKELVNSPVSFSPQDFPINYCICPGSSSHLHMTTFCWAFHRASTSPS